MAKEEVNKYKLTLLKDLPDYDAGTVLLNITQEEMDGTKNYYGSKKSIFYLRDNPTWVKVEKDNRCDCLTQDAISICYSVIGYGRSLSSTLNFKHKRISVHYDYACDSGKSSVLSIKYCPLCGRELT